MRSYSIEVSSIEVVFHCGHPPMGSSCIEVVLVQAGGRAGGRPCYMKIRLNQPNIVELGLRLILAKIF